MENVSSARHSPQQSPGAADYVGEGRDLFIYLVLNVGAACLLLYSYRCLM
jgi:hypothetical protein